MILLLQNVDVVDPLQEGGVGMVVGRVQWVDDEAV